ncbi:hypothetical protein ACLB2K_060062 [Fragaria x ananassa]
MSTARSAEGEEESRSRGLLIRRVFHIGRRSDRMEEIQIWESPASWVRGIGKEGESESGELEEKLRKSEGTGCDTIFELRLRRVLLSPVLNALFCLRSSFLDANEASGDVSLERISRLLIERGDFPAVPIDFDYPCSDVTGWSQWVDYELKDEAVRERLSRAGVLSAVFISSRCDINRDIETLRHVVRRWNPHTHTFVCAWG